MRRPRLCDERSRFGPSEPVAVPEVPDNLVPRDWRDDHFGVLAEQAHLRDAGGPVSVREYLARMWSFRHFMQLVALGRHEARHQSTRLGRLWYLINPLLLILIYYLLFAVVLGIEDRRGVDDYLPFLTVGVITYGFTRSSVHAGALALGRGAALVRSLSFPRAILPLGSVIGQGVPHLYAVVVMLAVLPVMGQAPSVRWLLLPVVLVVQAVLNLGLAFIAARLTFEVPDLVNLLPFVLRLGLYVSGVLVPINEALFPRDGVRWLLQANPVYSVLEMTRQVLLDGPLDAAPWAIGVAWSLVLLTGGFAYFRRNEYRYSGG